MEEDVVGGFNDHRSARVVSSESMWSRIQAGRGREAQGSNGMAMQPHNMREIP